MSLVFLCYCVCVRQHLSQGVERCRASMAWGSLRSGGAGRLRCGVARLKASVCMVCHAWSVDDGKQACARQSQEATSVRACLHCRVSLGEQSVSHTEASQITSRAESTQATNRYPMQAKNSSKTMQSRTAATCPTCCATCLAIQMF